MNEMLKIAPEQPDREKEISIDKVFTEFGGVYTDEEGIAHAVTLDGEGVVAIPGDVARLIAFSLKVQDKVFTGNYPRLEKRLALLNCRKAALVASDKMTPREATESSNEDVDGLIHLFDDVERIQEAGYLPTVVHESYGAEIESVLDEYSGTFPCLVHIFEVEKYTPRHEQLETALEEEHGYVPQEVVKSLHRAHSFMVLGEDEHGYVCFQKMGPDIHKPFMVASLDHMVFSYPLPAEREGLVFVGPA